MHLQAFENQCPEPGQKHCHNPEIHGGEKVLEEPLLLVDGAAVSVYDINQGEDNDYYMNHTFEGTVNSSGAIIMDYRDDKYLKDWNTFIYGHNMKNGSMFGSLKKLLDDETLYDSDPYIYVYLPGYIYRYKIFSYYKDKPDSKMYWTADTLQEYRQYIRDALSLSVRDLGVETSVDNLTVGFTGYMNRRGHAERDAK